MVTFSEWWITHASARARLRLAVKHFQPVATLLRQICFAGANGDGV
jgi:hypothetical protein